MQQATVTTQNPTRHNFTQMIEIAFSPKCNKFIISIVREDYCARDLTCMCIQNRKKKLFYKIIIFKGTRERDTL